MEAAEEPSMTCHQVVEEEAPVEEEEGQVIGYFQLDHNRLQLVEGENTFYLPPEALGEHVLMTEDGKEGQQIIVVVEEGSEDAVVQAFDARALLGDQATFTVDQLQGALSGSVSLSDQFAGMTAITAGDQQQLLILSEDPGEKESPGLEDTAVVPGASPGEENADTENILLYQEGSGEVPPEQCSTASDAAHGELQPGLEELPEGTGDLNKTLEALGSGRDILGSSAGLEVCPGALPLGGNLRFVAENEQALQEELGKCAEAEFGMQPPVVEDNSECGTGQIEPGFGCPQAGSEMGDSVDPEKNGLLQCQPLPAVLMRQEEPDISQGGNQEQPVITGLDENEALTMMTESLSEELLEQAPPTSAQQEKVPGVIVAYPSPATLPATSKHYDQLSSVESTAGEDRKFHETVPQINKLPVVQGAKNSEDKLVDSTADVPDMQIYCSDKSRSNCKEREAKLDEHKCSNVNELFNEKKEGQVERSVYVNKLFNKQPDKNRGILLQSVSKEGFNCSDLPENSELDIDDDSQNIVCRGISAAKCHGERQERHSEAAEAAQVIPSETPADLGQSTRNQTTSSCVLVKDKEQVQVTSASDSSASPPEKSPVKDSKEDGSLKEAAFEEAEGHLMLSDLEPEKEDEAKVREQNIMDVEDKLTPNEDDYVVKETISDALQPRFGADIGATSNENILDGQSQDELSRSPNSTEGQGHSEDEEAYSADHDRCLEETAHESTKEAEFSDHELQEHEKDKPKGNALSTDSSIVLESGTSGSKEHDSSRELSDLDQSGEKLLAALDLMPCPEASNLPTNDTAKPPPTSKPRDIFPELKPKRKRASVSQDEASSHGKKRWSLRTPTKPRKRVIIPDSDDDDFDVYESYNIPDDTQKNKSEEAFDALLSFFKIEKAQQEAAEAAGTKKRNAKKSPKGVAPRRKTHGKSLEAASSEAASSTRKEMRSPKEVPTAKGTPSLKQERIKSLENVARKNSGLKRQENASVAPSPSPTKQAPSPTKQAPSPTKQAPPLTKQAPSPTKHAPPPTKQAPSPTKQAPPPTKQAPSPTKQAPPPTKQAPSSTKQTSSPAKQARKRRSEPTESLCPKEDVLAESCKRIPSLSDTFAGDIHIRCQKPSCSSDKGVPRYHCSKCGFRSARVENIIWHHKQDCPYTRNLHRWDPKPWNQADVPEKSLQQPA